MSMTSSISSPTSDDLAIHILNKKIALHAAKQNISPKKVTKLCMNEQILKFSSYSKDVNDKLHSDRKISAANEYKFIEELITKFNVFYENCDLFLTNYFEEQLLALHNAVETILNYYYKIFQLGVDISYEHYENLKIIVLLMTSVLVEFENLINEAQILREEQMAREKEIEQLNMVNEIQHSLGVDINADLLNELFSTMEAVDPQYLNNIKKIVNNICSQVTSDNPTHSLGRLDELIHLLELKDVPLVGSQNVLFNLQKYTSALPLCWSFLQQAVITQAESQFSMNIDTAVTFASLLAAVLGRFPEQLVPMVSVLHSKYLSLLHSSSTVTDSGNNHNGDNNDEEEEEEEEDKLRRLKGVSRLLAAVLVAQCPPGFVVHPNLSPAPLWGLLARICRDDIVPSYSSEACSGLLEMGGTTLWTAYGDQFEKLLVALRRKFNQHGGLSERSLILLINNALDKREFEHQGYLKGDIWSSRCE